MLSFGMKYKFWKEFEQEMKVDLDIGRPSMLFEILVLSTPFAYTSSLKVIKEANLTKMNNPKICRQYFDKWNETGIWFKELERDLYRTEDRLMLDIYGKEGTAKSLYGGLSVNKKLDPSFHAGRIRNKQREIIQLIAEVHKEEHKGFKMLMRDENAREFGPDSWVSSEEIHNQLMLLREDQIGYCNVAPFTSYDMNYHFSLRMIDNTFMTKELPEQKFDTMEERVKWMCEEPQFARAIVSTLSSRHGDRWKRQGPFGFIVLPFPAFRFDTALNKWNTYEDGINLVVEYLKFKKEQNRNVSEGSYSRNDYTGVIMKMVKFVFENDDVMPSRARFYFKTRTDKELGRIITGVNQSNARLLAKDITSQDEMWRNCSDNVIDEMASGFNKMICLDMGLIDMPVEELTCGKQKIKEMYEEYERATGNIGTETMAKEEYT